jgi:hypothetical protein
VPAGSLAQASADDDARTVLRAAVVARHAEHSCHTLYAALRRTRRRSCCWSGRRGAACDARRRARCSAARDRVVCSAREVYGESEALRFQGGPIEPNSSRC